MLTLGLILFLTAVNGWTAIQFWRDKQRARTGARRIPEAELLALALLGGSPAALLARRMIRHKTRKEPFSTSLYAITFVQAGALAGFALG